MHEQGGVKGFRVNPNPLAPPPTIISHERRRIQNWTKAGFRMNSE